VDATHIFPIAHNIIHCFYFLGISWAAMSGDCCGEIITDAMYFLHMKKFPFGISWAAIWRWWRMALFMMRVIFEF